MIPAARLLARILLTIAGLGVTSCAAPVTGTRATTAPPAAATGPLTVATFNIRYGTAEDGANRWSNRYELVFDVLREMDADIVGLQEALRFQLDEIAAALPGYAEVGVGRRDGREAGEYAAILYRADRLELLANGTFWLSDTPEVPGSMTWGNRIPRICTWARFADRRTGARFFVYNAHFDHESQPSRERSAALLRRRIAERAPPDPFIITGDFNALPESRTMTILREGIEPGDAPLTDAFATAPPPPSTAGADPGGTFHAFTGEAGSRRIDYVLASPGWQVTDATVVRTSRDDRYPSDHFPVRAVLRPRRSP